MININHSGKEIRIMDEPQYEQLIDLFTISKYHKFRLVIMEKGEIRDNYIILISGGTNNVVPVISPYYNILQPLFPLNTNITS